MVVISFVRLQKINNFPKFGRCGSKIEPATPIWNSKLDWAWQAQFLSHIHEFLQNYLFFKDLQMILVSFFEIFDGFWSTKKLPSLLLHVNQDLLAFNNYSICNFRFTRRSWCCNKRNFGRTREQNVWKYQRQSNLSGCRRSETCSEIRGWNANRYGLGSLGLSWK